MRGRAAPRPKPERSLPASGRSARKTAKARLIAPWAAPISATPTEADRPPRRLLRLRRPLRAAPPAAGRRPAAAAAPLRDAALRVPRAPRPTEAQAARTPREAAGTIAERNPNKKGPASAGPFFLPRRGLKSRPGRRAYRISGSLPPVA